MTTHEPQGWAGKRVTVMGLGTRAGGVGVARYLAESGAFVTVTDLRTEELLAESMADLSNLEIRYVLGRHEPDDFTNTDVVIRNPGVRRDNPYLDLARSAGVPIEMEMAIFLRACPAPVIGVTGTKGKTTTSAICGEMLRHWRDDTLVAGNMGVSAVGALGRVTGKRRYCWNSPVGNSKAWMSAASAPRSRSSPISRRTTSTRTAISRSTPRRSGLSRGTCGRMTC